MFAQLLPDAERARTAHQTPARGSKPAESAKTGMRSEHGQTNSTQASEAPQSKPTQTGPRQERDAAKGEDDTPSAAAPRTENAQTLDTATVVAGLTTIVAPPAEQTALKETLLSGDSAATKGPEVSTEDTGVSVPGVPGSKRQASPQTLQAALQTLQAAPQTAGAPAIEPAIAADAGAQNPSVVGPAISKPAPQVQAGNTADPGLPANDQHPLDISMAKTAMQAPTDQPSPDVRSGKPIGETSEAPTPTIEDREPGNPTIDALKIAKPAPDAQQLGKPGTAADAEAGAGAPIDQAEIPEDALPTRPRTGLVRLDNVKPQTSANPGGDNADLEPTADETEIPTAGKAETKGSKSAIARESAAPQDEAEPARAAKGHSNVEFRPLIADPADVEFHITDVRISQPINLSGVSVPGAHSPHGAVAATPMPAQAPPSAPVPIDGIAFAIANNAQGGRNRFEIRLDPPELGRINVHLHIDSKGHVTSHLIVDRAETLDLLRRDASDLERSLQQAGLKTSDSGLQFSLRNQSPNSDGDAPKYNPTAYVVVPDTDPAKDIVMRGYTRAGEGAGLDIRV